MTINNRIHSSVPVLRKNTLNDLHSPGLFAKRPLVGLTMFLFGSLLFGALAYSVMTKGPLIRWDLATTKALEANTLHVPVWSLEYLLFGFFTGKELIILIGTILAIYFLRKHFWRELSMVLIGLGGGGMLWYFLSQYFARPRPGKEMDSLLLTDPSFPSGLALMSVLCYGLLAYLLIPKMPSRFWKWTVAIVAALVMIFSGFSGIILGVHYATDVIAGYALGIAWAGLVYTLMEILFREGTAPSQESSSARTASGDLRAPGLFGRKPIVGLILILLGGLVFAGLSYNLLAKGSLLQVDTTVHNSFIAEAQAAPPIVNEIMLFGFYLGKEVVQVIVAILIVYFVYKHLWPELAMLLISSPLGSVVWNFIIGYFNRPRPAEQTGLPITGIPSFPSGHAMSALICYGFLAYLVVPRMPSRFWKWTVGIAILLIVLFDGFSRVFQGNHYLTDVLAGYALGLAWAALVYTLIELFFVRKKV